MKAAFAQKAALSVLMALSTGASQGIASQGPAAAKHAGRAGHAKQTEGPIIATELIAGPFDLHRKYRSMEGPYMAQQITIGDLIATKSVILPESLINFTEDHPSGGPSMGAMQPTSITRPAGLIDTSSQPRQLYWFKGLKIDVLDENDKPLPTAEFICHLNLDVEPTFRNKVFAEGEPLGTSRLITLTQGQTDFMFPDGFAVPVASDEKFTLMFQAANRTTDKHRRLKHRCTLYFIRDKELMYPITALSWAVPFMTVVVDRNTADARDAELKDVPDCSGMTAGVTAPNSVPGSLFTDPFGRKVEGHWVVPPGEHTYTCPLVSKYYPDFASKNRRIIAVWSHVHPLCTSASLVACDGTTRKKIFSAAVKTDTSRGLEIKHIESIFSTEGIPLPPGKHYELEATYDNTTGAPSDSMITEGIFFADEKFSRPQWVASGKRDNAEAFCGVTAPKLSLSDNGITIGGMTGSAGSSAAQSTTKPLFDKNSDGPLLTATRVVELETSAGKIHIALDPTLAPQHATQIYRLMEAGAFDGTPITRYEPQYLLQVSTVEDKAAGQAPLSSQARSLVRRLPLEVSNMSGGLAAHHKWALSMARFDDANSAESSFSILLTDAPHLNNKYTVFGRLVPDDVTLKTLTEIERNWSSSHPYIVKVKDM